MSDETYSVERSITIDAPPSEIYPRLADFRAWIDWSPSEGLDPDSLVGPDFEKGLAQLKKLAEESPGV